MRIQLKDVASVQVGHSLRSRLEPSPNGSVHVIQMKDLRNDSTVDCSNLQRTEIENLKEHHLVLSKDLIFRSRGEIHKAAILEEAPLGQIVAVAPLLRIRVEKPEQILPEFLNWCISQPVAQKFLTSRAAGSSLKMISKEAMEELEIPLPELRTQQEIVELAALAHREQKLLKVIAQKRDQYISTTLMEIANTERTQSTRFEIMRKRRQPDA